MDEVDGRPGDQALQLGRLSASDDAPTLSLSRFSCKTTHFKDLEFIHICSDTPRLPHNLNFRAFFLARTSRRPLAPPQVEEMP